MNSGFNNTIELHQVYPLFLIFSRNGFNNGSEIEYIAKPTYP